MKSQLMFAIGLRVRQARENAGLTQEKLAELVDRTKEAISNIERGVNYPTIETLQRISDAVGMSMTYLLAEPSGSRSCDELKATIDTKLRGLEDHDLRFVATMIDSLTAYKESK